MISRLLAGIFSLDGKYFHELNVYHALVVSGNGIASSYNNVTSWIEDHPSVL